LSEFGAAISADAERVIHENRLLVRRDLDARRAVTAAPARINPTARWGDALIRLLSRLLHAEQSRQHLRDSHRKETRQSGEPDCRVRNQSNSITQLFRFERKPANSPMAAVPIAISPNVDGSGIVAPEYKTTDAVAEKSLGLLADGV
jgi:hypothetical protein